MSTVCENLLHLYIDMIQDKQCSDGENSVTFIQRVGSVWSRKEVVRPSRGPCHVRPSVLSDVRNFSRCTNMPQATQFK